ncbi:cupin domain-containing protein [Mesorhizobium tamadayense]|uniref:Cupin domain-containing protein n=1 Tax=Mesorhizobium tamadayense TaxID=425306 RepID=A0A3P3GC84_9HYPH|nr:cupin domain-containing protein [Mesorhizobium tamadayense]RRI07763.1 cupin domain-containing protein [Mesorhizobium tamadayense]
MHNPLQEHQQETAHLVDVRATEMIEIQGPTIQFLTPLAAIGSTADDDGPCVMRGTIPPGVSVPLHSHHDPETFLTLSGELEGLAESRRGFEWIRIEPGDVFHVPGGARHAFRNIGQEAAVMNIVSTARIARFFREVGRPVPASGEPPLGPPSAETIRHFLATAEKYGYWNASPEENARIGIALPDAS